MSVTCAPARLATPPQAESQQCSVDGCERPIKSKKHGLCGTHHQRWLRHGEVGDAALQHAVSYNGKTCSVAGCARKPKALGLCGPHYKRLVRWGDPLGSRPPTPVTPAPTPAASAQGLIVCTQDGCERPLVARGLCRRHYVAWYRRTPKDQRKPAANLKRLTPSERFEEKRERRGPDDCWPWTGSTHRSGHGEFFVSPERGTVPAHTYALELDTGIPCPPGREGCHHCDNPPCCNPAHVYYGTRQDNVDDMMRRGRGRRGAAVHTAKLTESQVVEMRGRFAAGETLAKLAADYGVSDGSVSMIVNGLRWTHVGGPITTRKRRT